MSYILKWSTYRCFTSRNMILLRKTGFRNWCQVVMSLVTRPPMAWSVNKILQDDWNPEWTFNLHWTHAYWVVTFTSFLSQRSWMLLVLSCLPKFAYGRFTRVPSPKSQVTWGQSVQSLLSLLLRSWKLGFTTLHGFQVLCSKYDMDAYMATHFGGEAWYLHFELGRAKS
jgi:hypothetical protein